ncbi:MAG: hypothetical protein WEA31_08260, partial [Pirellulales bacterium]
MFTSRALVVTCTLVVATSCASLVPHAAGQPPAEATVKLAAEATVLLTDGSRLTAPIDASSDTDRLVLRFETATATLLRRIAWSRVARIEVAGEQLTAEQLRARLDEFVSVRPRDEARRAGTTVSEQLPRPRQAPTVAPTVSPTVARTVANVRSVAVDAVAANWDADVPVDGLTVAIAPLDGWGRLVAASGTVEIELFGDHRSLRRPLPPTRHESFDRLGRWVVLLDKRHFSPAGYIFDLPYQGFDPAEKSTIRPQGLVNVRLSIPGQGVFEASATDVRLTPFSPLRNRIEAST